MATLQSRLPLGPGGNNYLHSTNENNMGYSITTRAKNKTLLTTMWEFMQTHYVQPMQLFNMPANYSRLAVNINEPEYGLSYDHAKLAIGFDYNAAEPERDYIYNVVRWMALKIGKTYKLKNIGSVPYYIYDGYEKTPIFVKKIWKNNIPLKYQWATVSSLGFKSMASKFLGTPAYNSATNKGTWLEKQLQVYTELMGTPWQTIDKQMHDAIKKLERAYKQH
jgi:hypothetical protein